VALQEISERAVSRW